MARTILGLDMVDTFTSSETCPGTEEKHGGVSAGMCPSCGTLCSPPKQRDRGVRAAGPTMVKGMNCRMLPRLPCSRHSTHSSMNHWTNWVWVPAVLAPRMEEMSRKRFAVGTGREQQSGHFWEAAGGLNSSLVPQWVDVTPQSHPHLTQHPVQRVPHADSVELGGRE